MQSLAEDFHAIVVELEAEGHKLAARLKAAVAKLTGSGESSPAAPAEPDTASAAAADTAASAK